MKKVGSWRQVREEEKKTEGRRHGTGRLKPIKHKHKPSEFASRRAGAGIVDPVTRSSSSIRTCFVIGKDPAILWMVFI